MAGEDSKEDDPPQALLASDIADKALDGPAQASAAADAIRHDAVEEDVEGDEEGDEDATHGEVDGGASKAKKKRKPKKKKKKAADGPTEPAAAPAEAKGPQPISTQDIPSLLKQLALGQSKDPKKEGKKPEDYKFWNTQPVPKFKEPNLLQTTNGAGGEELPEGAILPGEVCKASVKAEPEKLLEGFEWCLVDLDNEGELQELYDLLYNHYVEDNEGAFRFNYSSQFITWALKTPGWKKDWHIGVRTRPTAEGKKGKLIAFISGIPVSLKVRSHTLKASEINFLIVHRKLRSKRLAPLLIKEITRLCYKDGIYQALYTAGTLLPTPVTTCRYFHRSLDWAHLYKTGFSHLPPGTTELRQKYKYKVESSSQVKGLRPMKTADVPAVRDLLTRYLERFALRQEFSEAEIEHLLCSPASEGVVFAYVVEQDGKITDFISYYLLESTVLRAAKAETIRAAYLYYYATETAFPPSNGPKPKAASLQADLQHRLQQLVHDALIMAKKDDFHVFNALTLLDNPLFLREEKFEPGDGNLHYYLFNWRTATLPGGVNKANQIDTSKMGGVGVVML